MNIVDTFVSLITFLDVSRCISDVFGGLWIEDMFICVNLFDLMLMCVWFG